MLISYLLLSLLLFLFAFVKRWHLFCWLSYSVFLLCFLAIIPLPGEDKVKYTAPTQVVFRFDDHRFIQLTGYGCQGRMYYIDEQKQIYYELARHSGEVLTEPFAHMPEDYNTVENIAVINNQFFLKDKNRGIYRSPKPIGSAFAILSPANEEYLEGLIQYTGYRWTDQPKTMPIMPANYSGWQRWQCDPGLKQPITVYNRYAPLIKLQTQLRQLLGVSEEATHVHETN